MYETSSKNFSACFTYIIYNSTKIFSPLIPYQLEQIHPLLAWFVSREYIVDPYILLVQVGGLIKFKATNGAYSILINNADNFFEGVEPKEYNND